MLTISNTLNKKLLKHQGSQIKYGKTATEMLDVQKDYLKLSEHTGLITEGLQCRNMKCHTKDFRRQLLFGWQNLNTNPAFQIIFSQFLVAGKFVAI
jgi:hypothetical protein